MTSASRTTTRQTVEIQPAPRGAPLRPREDPFHAPPSDFGARPKGTILRARKIRPAAFGVIPQRVCAWQLLYVSSDLHGAPEAAVTTVLLPDGADPTRPRPLLAYQCAIDAVADHCFPSYALQRGARVTGSIPAFEYLLIARALRRGWAITIADHEGLDGRFGAPREPGYRALDGIRAALSFDPLGLQPTAKVALWGYSGGGMATSWCAEMAPVYAPELNIVGAVLGAPVSDPGETALKLNRTQFAGYPAAVIATLQHSYTAIADAIRDHATVTGRQHLDTIATLSTIGLLRRHRRHDLDTYLDLPLADLLSSGPILEVLDDLRLGQHVPACPLLVIQAVHDQIIDIADVDAHVQRYLDGGAHVTYRRDRLSEHISLAITSTPMALHWLDDRIAGRPLPPADTRTVWSVALSWTGVRGLLALGWNTIRTMLGRP